MPTVLPITTCVPGDHTVDHTTMLTDVLKLHFGWNLARIKCLSCLIIALFKVKTVNFAELATAFSGSAKPDSHYRRIQRFFKEVKIQQDMVAQLVASFLPYDQFILSMDRTNWMLGCFSINFLVLSIVHQGTAFPHCTGQKIKIADIVDKYDALAPLTHSRAASGSRAAPLACLVDLRGCFESDQIHSEKHSWLGVYVFLYESVSDH